MTEHHLGWKSTKAAHHYKKTADILIPERESILNVVARLATDFVDKESPLFLDIGCGDGDATAKIIEIKPDASFCLVDYSDEMVKMASERFGKNGNVNVLQHDLNDGLPDEVKQQRFDAVVSCIALHHTEYENRVKLYTDVKNVLSEDSLFINADAMRADCPALDMWTFDNWIRWMVEKTNQQPGKQLWFEQEKQRQLNLVEQYGDKCGTIWEMRSDLKDAGFRHVDTLMQYYMNAVVVATK